MPFGCGRYIELLTNIYYTCHIEREVFVAYKDHHIYFVAPTTSKAKHHEHIYYQIKILPSLNCCLENKGTVQDIIDELAKDSVSPLTGTTICQHLLIADWQCEQYNELKKC